MERGPVIVVGGGASGMMAAGRAAECGARTIVLEKMERPARKLRITGKGRCNLTNIAALPEFLSHFGRRGDFLRQAFARFFTEDLLAFLSELGVPTVTERGGRVFPASESAGDVAAALERWAISKGAILHTRMPVGKLILSDGRVTGVAFIGAAGDRADAPRGAASRKMEAGAVILATGGASYPGTGSSGDGYRLASSAGHTIVPIRPALVPLTTAGNAAQRMQGLSLRNVSVALVIDGRRRAQEFGELLFTHFGVSGPVALTLSGRAVEALALEKSVELAIDLKPALDEGALEKRLLREIETLARKRAQALLATLLPRKMIPVCADATGLALDAPCHQITVAQRRRLRAWLKDVRLAVDGHRPLTEAIVTAGGVDLREVDPRTLASRKVKGLHFCGEILDLDADTGGYNLQAAFSTGRLAGEAAAAAVMTSRARASLL